MAQFSIKDFLINGSVSFYYIHQEVLANYLGISRTKLSKIEKNELDIDVDIAAKICDYFDISLEYLYYGEEKKIKTSEVKTNENSKVIFKKLNLIATIISIIIFISTISFFGYYVYKKAILGSKENLTPYVVYYVFFVLLIFFIILILYTIRYKIKINNIKNIDFTD